MSSASISKVSVAALRQCDQEHSSFRKVLYSLSVYEYEVRGDRCQMKSFKTGVMEVSPYLVRHSSGHIK